MYLFRICLYCCAMPRLSRLTLKRTTKIPHPSIYITRTCRPTPPPPLLLLPLVVGEESAAAASSPARDLSGRAGTWRAASARARCIPGRTGGSCCRANGRRGGIRLFWIDWFSKVSSFGFMQRKGGGIGGGRGMKGDWGMGFIYRLGRDCCRWGSPWTV